MQSASAFSSFRGRMTRRKPALLLLVLLAVFSAPLHAQGDAANIPADSLLQRIKSQSVHRKLTDWNQVEPEFRARLNRAKSDDEVLNAFVYLFSRMNDVHSAIYYKNRYYGYYKGVDAETARALRPLLEREQSQSGKIRASVLENRYGYILIPTIQAAGRDSINEYAQSIQDEVCKAGSNRIEGWIVDLRLNGGGNVNPMLAGLGNLLGDKVIAGDVDADDKLVHRWSLRRGDLYLDEDRQTSIKNRCGAKYERTPVVILVGAITRSSGELTAIAFKYRPNTYFIGEPTAEGYTTSNDLIQINSELALNLATGYMADRKGMAYKTQLFPDLKIAGGDSFDNLADDEKVRAAIDWLNKRSGVRRRQR